MQPTPGGRSPRSGRGVSPRLEAVPENGAIRDGPDMNGQQRQHKLDQLKQAMASNNPDAIKQRLESTSALRLAGEEDLDQAAHNLWQLEARPAARQELEQAMAKGSRLALEAALEAAAAVGLPAAELEAGQRALRQLELSPIWKYDSGDGHHIDLRKEPRMDGPRVRQKLECGDLFCVSEERKMDSVTYLCLADGRGWAFDKKPGVGNLCTRHVVTEADKPGTYVIIHDQTAVTRTDALGGDSDIISKLAVNAIVNIVEIVNKTGVRRFRGRLENPPGWISLLDSETGKRWAVRKKVEQLGFGFPIAIPGFR